MPKKNLSEKSLVEEKSIEEHKNHISKQKKLGHEIDQIFSGKKKREKPEQGQAEKQTEIITIKQKKKMKKNKSVVPKGDVFSDLSSRPRKKSKDGLIIYTEEELGIGKSDAGGTPLCPFDCSCCF